MDVNTTAAPEFEMEMVLKDCKVKTKIMVHLMDVMDNMYLQMKVVALTKSHLTIETEVEVMTEFHTVEKRLTQHIHMVVLPMSKPHMMKGVVTSELCMLAMMQCQPRNMMINMEMEVRAVSVKMGIPVRMCPMQRPGFDVKPIQTMIQKAKPMTMKEERLFHTQMIFQLDICGT